MSETRVWELSVGENDEHFYVSCPYPISGDDVADVLEFLEIIRRQIARSFGVAQANPQELHQLAVDAAKEGLI